MHTKEEYVIGSFTDCEESDSYVTDFAREESMEEVIRRIVDKRTVETPYEVFSLGSQQQGFHWKACTARESSLAYLKPSLLRPSRLQLAIQSARDRILALEDDWDNEGSAAYAPECLDRVERFLMSHARLFRARENEEIPAPSIDPGPQQGIDLHWEFESFELLVHIPGVASEPARFYGDNFGNTTIKGTLDLNSKPNRGLIQWLASS